MNKLTKFLKTLLLLFIILTPTTALALEEEQIYKGKVIQSNIVSCGEFTDQEDFNCLNYEVEILEGEYEGQVVETMPTWLKSSDDTFTDNSDVYISLMQDYEGNDVWSIQSYSRENSLLFLFLVFVVLIVLITGVRGLRATIGLAISFLILYFFAVPRISQGEGIFLIAVLTLAVLLVASTFVTYGFNIKSLIAFTSTFLGILIISALGYFVISWLNISGMGEESSAMLADNMFGTIQLSNVFLLSIVIGALGVLDDVTVGQASSMIEIFETDKNLDSNQLYKKSMNIGKDHIASMVNTLFIAYAGSSFTLIMLLSVSNPDFRVLLNTGFVVEEIVRTLVASIGLVLIVPLSAFLASRIIVRVLK